MRSGLALIPFHAGHGKTRGAKQQEQLRVAALE